MDDINIVQLLARWFHLGSVIVLVGGAAFMRLILIPAAESLPESEHDGLRQRILQKWKRVVMITIALILISGTVNLVITAKSVTGLWHGLVGVKILIALAVFFVASALVGRSKGLEPIRAQAPKWLAINLVLATIIVLISGLLRYLPRKPSGEVVAPASATAQAVP